MDKIGNFEELLTSGQAILVDEVGNPLKKVEFLGDYDNEVEAASVENDMARSMSSERVGFGTQSLLKQWKDSYGNGDYDEDPYNDDMYEGQDLPQEIQVVCDNLDIRVRGLEHSKRIEIHILLPRLTAVSSTSCEVFGIVGACEDESVGVGAESAVVVDAFDV
ncbi:hypothetical protein Tco_0511062 [Tanacetum coccineum]